MKQYGLAACQVLWRELCYYAALSPHTFHLEFLAQGLHDTPDALREAVQASVDAFEGRGLDAVLLGYGLCSNGLVGVTARTTPLAVMRGHDCITFLLGSKERYRTYFDAHPGTYWYSPGWIDAHQQPGRERYETVLAQYVETYGEENARYLMEAAEGWMTQYDRAVYVDMGFGDPEPYMAYTKACADWLGWRYERLEGAPALIRRFVNGDWRDEEVLCVAPGQRIAASHDDAIITAEDGDDD